MTYSGFDTNTTQPTHKGDPVTSCLHEKKSFRKTEMHIALSTSNHNEIPPHISAHFKRMSRRHGFPHRSGNEAIEVIDLDNVRADLRDLIQGYMKSEVESLSGDSSAVL
jgi:hypothetical protein